MNSSNRCLSHLGEVIVQLTARGTGVFCLSKGVKYGPVPTRSKILRTSSIKTPVGYFSSSATFHFQFKSQRTIFFSPADPRRKHAPPVQQLLWINHSKGPKFLAINAKRSQQYDLAPLQRSLLCPRAGSKPHAPPKSSATMVTACVQQMCRRPAGKNLPNYPFQKMGGRGIKSSLS